jgi:membrane-bound lytic murein transglycosylase D
LTCLLLSLSSCATQEALFGFIDFPELDSAEEIALLSESSATSPPELLPQPVEDEKCITQELDALEQTGSWDEKENIVAADVREYDFPIVINKQVKMYIDLFQHKQRKYFEKWLARSTRYLPIILEEFEKEGLPKDLAYLAMIESGFNQRAYSRAKAVGMWQFMRGTGRDYNLKIDNYVDERRHAVKSTRAAVAYLNDLYRRFNDWHLAVAAYNAGPGKIRYGLKRFNTKDFWELAEKKYLSLETKRYVPKLIAAIIIAKDPEKYGFTDIKYAAPLQYDTIEVGPGLSIDALALISGSSKQELGLLNQELKTGRTPLNQRTYLANIPRGSHSEAAANLGRLHSVVKTGYKTHVIDKNDTLTAICGKYNVNKTTLLKVNNLRNGTLHQGQRLRIPYSVVDYQLLPKNGSAIAHSGDSLILHTIKPGETISKIATKYSVPSEMIVAWNGLKSAHKIRAGQQLALYIIDDGAVMASTTANGQNPTITTASAVTDHESLLVLADNKKSNPEAEGSTQEEFSWYQVKNGDTLWNISRRFKTSPKNIKVWNNLESNLIHPGNKLRLKDV